MKSRMPRVQMVLAGLLLMGMGCATNIRRATVTNPPTVRFSEFSSYVMKPIEIAPGYAAADANQKATRKIQEALVRYATAALPGLQVTADAATPSKGRTLRIEPTVLEIKFIGGAARFWVGAMAGSSAVLMRVDFVDAKTGEVVANPEFYRAASAYAGGMPGQADNMMLDEVARDIGQYIQYNR